MQVGSPGSRLWSEDHQQEGPLLRNTLGINPCEGIKAATQGRRRGWILTQLQQRPHWSCKGARSEAGPWQLTQAGRIGSQLQPDAGYGLPEGRYDLGQGSSLRAKAPRAILKESLWWDLSATNIPSSVGGGQGMTASLLKGVCGVMDLGCLKVSSALFLLNYSGPCTCLHSVAAKTTLCLRCGLCYTNFTFSMFHGFYLPPYLNFIFLLYPWQGLRKWSITNDICSEKSKGFGAWNANFKSQNCQV